MSSLAAEGLDYFEKSGDAGDAAYVDAIRLHIKDLESQVEELAQARARIAVLMEIGHAAWHLLDSTGHDMSKDIYEVPAQDVAALEKALDLTGHFDFHDYMQEHPAQSLAAVRAGALRDAADDWEPQPCPLTRPAIREQLRLRADRIEREAKEES